jgi:hypothetical protein
MRRGIMRRPPKLPPLPIKQVVKEPEPPKSRGPGWVRPVTYEEMTPWERERVMEQRREAVLPSDEWYLDKYGDLRPKSAWDKV